MATKAEVKGYQYENSVGRDVYQIKHLLCPAFQMPYLNIAPIVNGTFFYTTLHNLSLNSGNFWGINQGVPFPWFISKKIMLSHVINEKIKNRHN